MASPCRVWIIRVRNPVRKAGIYFKHLIVDIVLLSKVQMKLNGKCYCRWLRF